MITSCFKISILVVSHIARHDCLQRLHVSEWCHCRAKEYRCVYDSLTSYQSNQVKQGTESLKLLNRSCRINCSFLNPWLFLLKMLTVRYTKLSIWRIPPSSICKPVSSFDSTILVWTSPVDLDARAGMSFHRGILWGDALARKRRTACFK